MQTNIWKTLEMYFKMKKSICAICNREFNSDRLSSHVSIIHKIRPQEYYDKYLKKENEGICKNCGKPTKYLNFRLGYRDCCSRTCTNILRYNVPYTFQSEEVKNKAKETKLFRYGDPHYNNREQVHKTNLKNLGVEMPFMSNEVQQKCQDTCFKHYGVRNPYSSDVIRKQIVETFIYNYGVDNPRKSEEIKKKIKSTIEQNHDGMGFGSLDITKSIFSTIDKNIKKLIDDGFIKFSDLNLKYSTEIAKILRLKKYCSTKYIHQNDVEKAIKIDTEFRSKEKVYNSTYEAEIHEWLKSIYSGKIEINTRRIISPLELDIYLPEKNLALEFNGDYWHSANRIDKNYHLNKTLLCQEKGIHLIHIFEYEWNENKEYIKSIISSAIKNHKNEEFIGFVKENNICMVVDLSKENIKRYLNDNFEILYKTEPTICNKEQTIYNCGYFIVKYNKK